jgi:hypothetical protein
MRVYPFSTSKRRRRQAQRNVTQIVGREGRFHVETREIIDVFYEHLCQKYASITVDNESVRTLMSVNHKQLNPHYEDALGAPLTLEEVRHAWRRGGVIPHQEGMVLAVRSSRRYETAYMETSWNCLHRCFPQVLSRLNKKEGVIVCIPKTATPNHPHEYRPITLLNNDYKTLARLMAGRMSEVLEELLHPSQYCGVKGKSIFKAAGTIRDVIAYAEVTRKPLYVISLDFKKAFDRISNDYLFATLKSYGISDKFVGQIQNTYSEVRSVVQINGHNISAPIPIRCGFRQGFPLSRMLFALCLDPLICWLDEYLHGVWIRPGQRTTAVVAYADDVTVLATTPVDNEVPRQALCCYERATGAIVNITKSQALAVGRWDTARRVLDIPYRDEIRILWLRMSPTTGRSRDASWTRIVDSVRIKSREAYTRDLLLPQRIQYAQTYLLAKIWHAAQVFSIPRDCVQRLMSVIASFLWRGALFRVPVSTLQRKKEEGGGVCWTWQTNVEQYCSFGSGSRVSVRARWRERGNNIGACASTVRTPRLNR